MIRLASNSIIKKYEGVINKVDSFSDFPTEKERRCIFNMNC